MAGWLFHQTEMFEDYQRGKQTCFLRDSSRWAALNVHRLGIIPDGGSWIHRNLQGL